MSSSPSALSLRRGNAAPALLTRMSAWAYRSLSWQAARRMPTCTPVRPGGYLTPWKAANTIKATTMARTGCQSIPRALLSVIEGGVFVDRLARSTS